MAEARLRAKIHGRVQRVYFRDFTRTRARGLGVAGYVRNLMDGAVEVVAEGQKEDLEKLVSALRTGPPSAQVEKVDVEWGPAQGDLAGFEIRYG